MRSKVYTFCWLFALLVVCGGVALAQKAAQKQEPLRADWLAADVANVERLLPELKRNEPLTLRALEQIFGGPARDERDLGFGGRTFAFSKAGGYTSFRVSGFVFNDRIGYYTISVSGSVSWPRIKTVIIATWKRNSDLEVIEDEWSIENYREIENVTAEYKAAVAAQLGEMAPVTVPPELRDAYELLTSLRHNSVVGEGGCGYGAVTPEGKNAIDAIVNANRVDLINNILRGHNPGGRVYAFLALFAMQRKGASLTDDTWRMMDAVRTLNIELTRCDGCIFGYETAQQILNKWVFK